MKLMEKIFDRWTGIWIGGEQSSKNAVGSEVANM